jgi:hypothetical protein
MVLSLFAATQGAEHVNAAKQHIAQMEESKSGNTKEDVPPGGCTPIGLTARGDVVFPWPCRGLIEKYRGPLSEEAPDAAPRTDPAQNTPAAKVEAEPQPPNGHSQKKGTSAARRLQANPDITGSIGRAQNQAPPKPCPWYARCSASQSSAPAVPALPQP